jgi:tetratricopeptide (TPR) repeat protein
VLPFLNKFFGKGSKPERQDYYQLAYCFYQTKNYTKAIENYKKVLAIHSRYWEKSSLCFQILICLDL